MLSTYSISIHIFNLIFMDQVNEPPKSKFKLILGVIVVLAVLAGAVYYYAWPKGDAGDAPPSLELDTGSNLQGLMQSTDQLNFAVGEASDVAAWDALNCADPVDVPKGISYYYLTKDMKAEDAIKLFKFSFGMRGLLAQYSAADNAYYMYPFKGPYSPTPGSSFEVKKAEADFELSAYNGFVFISELDTQACNVKGAKDMVNDLDTPLLMDSVFPVPPGWVLLPTNDGVDLFQPYLEGLLGDDLTSLWSQTEQNAYDLTDELVAPSSYAFTWYKFEKELTLEDIGYPVVTSDDVLAVDSATLVGGAEVDSVKLKYNKVVVLGDGAGFDVCEKAEGEVVGCVEGPNVGITGVTWDVLTPDYLTLQLGGKLEVGKTYVVTSSELVTDVAGGELCSLTEVCARNAILEVVEVEDTEAPFVVSASAYEVDDDWKWEIWITMSEDIVMPDDALAAVSVCLLVEGSDTECDGADLALDAVAPNSVTDLAIDVQLGDALVPDSRYLVTVMDTVTDKAGNGVSLAKNSDVVEVAHPSVEIKSAEWSDGPEATTVGVSFNVPVEVTDEAGFWLCVSDGLYKPHECSVLYVMDMSKDIVVAENNVSVSASFTNPDVSASPKTVIYWIQAYGFVSVDTGELMTPNLDYVVVGYEEAGCDDEGCEAGEYCGTNGTCYLYGEVGQSCDDDNPCADELECVGNICEEVKTGLGGGCVLDNECADGLACNDGSLLCTVICADDEGCEDGEYCGYDKTCFTYAGVDEACDEQFVCGEGLDCEGGFCVVEECDLLGDVDGDDDVDCDDLYIVNDMISDGDDPTLCSDVNGDGELDVVDFAWYGVNEYCVGVSETCATESNCADNLTCNAAKTCVYKEGKGPCQNDGECADGLGCIDVVCVF